uniref:Uncharacterized protein n=1 Tax=Trypanosoma vivax (strain Y486) TaxID=1055687 RepID=G0U962_TRYVY|nr:hypothetical protein, unlikely [Trypanosoma vivax Y486]
MRKQVKESRSALFWKHFADCGMPHEGVGTGSAAVARLKACQHLVGSHRIYNWARSPAGTQPSAVSNHFHILTSNFPPPHAYYYCYCYCRRSYLLSSHFLLLEALSTYYLYSFSLLSVLSLSSSC